MERKVRPIRVGITGGIGSGKSLVCKIFQSLGVAVYDADSRAKWLTNHNEAIRDKILGLLGSESYTTSGDYNRAFVASRVFNNSNLLTKLNQIIHPVVIQDGEDWMASKVGHAYVLKEAAIMNKAGENNSLDYVVVVHAPEAVRIERILKRDNRTREEIQAIIARQLTDLERDKIGDFKILNDNQSALIPQVMELHHRFTHEGEKRI